MEARDAAESIRTWLSRPLCRRYAAAVFSTALTPRRGADQPFAISWALGSLVNGEMEVLGTWFNADPGVAAPPAVFGDLYLRGAEFIRFGVGDLAGTEAAFRQTYRHAKLAPSISQALESAEARVSPRHRMAVSDALRRAAEVTDLELARAELARFQRTDLGQRYAVVTQQWWEALAGFQPIHALHEPLRELVRLTEQTAAVVRGRLERAIHRHGPFIDSAAALDFIAIALLGAERRLDREQAAALKAREVLGPGLLNSTSAVGSRGATSMAGTAVLA